MCVCVCVLLRVRFSIFRLSTFHLVAPFCALRELSRCYLINYRTFVPFPIVKYGENSPIKIFKISTERAALGRMQFLMRLPIRQYDSCLLFHSPNLSFLCLSHTHSFSLSPSHSSLSYIVDKDQDLRPNRDKIAGSLTK